jgi:Cdc6-like AAA superfamily ATPase
MQFQSVYVNGLSLGTPDKLWKRFLSQINKSSSGGGGGRKNANGKQETNSSAALKKLNSYFETRGRLPVVLVIDELDQLLDKKQSILYQLLEWTTRPSNMFSLIAIFNTMSLPENALMNRNASRMVRSSNKFHCFPLL